MNNDKTKGILQTNSKVNSKGRRISWGEVKIKEYESEEEVSDNNKDKGRDSINLNNITIGIGGGFGFMNDTIVEEPSSIEAGSRASSSLNERCN
jgi:hypothetical protein